MPITPFHMGPGILAKAAGGRHLSLMVFGFSQVAIDLEVAVHMVRQDDVLHGFAHTWIGATLVALLSVVIGTPCCVRLSRFVQRSRHLPTVQKLPWPDHIAWPAAVVGAFTGTYSHIVLDGVMHLDMHALAPFSEQQPLLGLVSVTTLYLFCLACGVLGWLALAPASARAEAGRTTAG
jgi:hypothetical protein